MEEFFYNNKGESIDVSNYPLIDFRYFLSCGGFGDSYDYLPSKFRCLANKSLQLIENTLSVIGSTRKFEIDAEVRINKLLLNTGADKTPLYEFYKANYLYFLGASYDVLKDFLIFKNFETEDYFIQSDRIRSFWLVFHNCFEIIDGMLNFNSERFIEFCILWKSDLYHKILRTKPTGDAVNILNEEVLNMSFEIDTLRLQGEEYNYLKYYQKKKKSLLEYFKNKLYESTVGLSSTYDEELTDVVNELDPIYDAEGRSLALYYLFINEKVTRGNAQKKLKVSKNNSTQKFLEYYKEYEDYYNNVSTLCNSKNRKQIFALRKIYRNTKELLVYKEFSTKEVDSALSIIETFILDN